MFIATLIVSIFLAVALSVSAFGKLSKNPQIVSTIEGVGVPTDRIPWLAYAEILGAVGLVVGLFVWPVGVAAAIGVILYFVGAVIAHLRVDDAKGTGPSAFLTLVAVAALVLRLLSI
ncbi:DoxX family protein [Rhodococcoides yunnanense]|uniref:DoxX family protein n=1 Tax=Rhodococcoides yunnanense TaxID=278209 RepID=UPI0009330C6A|nr:DoxX family protein [Rhodococcus yunnanensis]